MAALCSFADGAVLYVPSAFVLQVDGAIKLQEELVTDPQPALVLNEEMQSSLKPSPGSEEKNVKSIQEVRLAS
jgi:hypothetical protein